MTTARTYGDGCGVAHALDLVGERWALLVVRELLLGPLRFSDLRVGLPGASPNVLSQRLREMEHVGVVRRRKLAPPAASWVYELTEHGAELGPIVTALGTWALRSPLEPSGWLSAVSAMLTLRTYYASADDWSALVQIRLGDRSYLARVAEGHVDVTADQTSAPDAIIDTTPSTFVALLTRQRDLTEAAAAEAVRLSGDLTAVQRLVAGVVMPVR
jgi:DNA-binding HxlR family transcriptional regulator/putative sterol carrier protein